MSRHTRGEKQEQAFSGGITQGWSQCLPTVDGHRVTFLFLDFLKRVDLCARYRGFGDDVSTNSLSLRGYECLIVFYDAAQAYGLSQLIVSIRLTRSTSSDFTSESLCDLYKDLLSLRAFHSTRGTREALPHCDGAPIMK